METIELITYIAVAIMIGGLIIMFITDIQVDDVYTAMRSMLQRDETLRFSNVDAADVAPKAFNVWRQCGYGQREGELVISLREGNTIDKAYLFQHYKKYNLCFSIQSADHDCGTREDLSLNPEEIEGPALLNIRCDTENTQLIIEEI